MTTKRWEFDGRTPAGIRGIKRWHRVTTWLMKYPEVITDPYYAEVKEALQGKIAELSGQDRRRREEIRAHQH